MKTDKKSRLLELEERFQQLEPNITDRNTKEALSLIHGMLNEIWRQASDVKQEQGKGREEGSIDIANIYKRGPKMEGQAVSKPLPLGTKAPDFTLKDANGNEVSLSDFRGTSVLLVFYPLDWSPGCSQQLDLYSHELKEFEKRGVKVLGISVDSIYSHGAWAAVRKIEFPLLSDFNPKGEVAARYGIFRDKDGFSERALYLVDDQGVIRFSHVSPQIHHIPDIYELFRRLNEIHKPERVSH